MLPEPALKHVHDFPKPLLQPSSLQVEAPADVDVPDSLLPEPELQRLLEEQKPCFLPLAGMPEGTSAYSQPDPITGGDLSCHCLHLDLTCLPKKQFLLCMGDIANACHVSFMTWHLQERRRE